MARKRTATDIAAEQRAREQQEVVGYYETLQIILDNYQDINLTERYIHQLHGILLKHSGKDQSHKGKYKTLSNQVVANYPNGTQRTIFRTTEAKELGTTCAGLLVLLEKTRG